MALLFALPVYLAYHFADWIEALVDGAIIRPLVDAISPLANVSPLLFAMLAGDYENAASGRRIAAKMC